MNFSPGDLKRPELAKHDSSILDLAFVMDCTGSMMSYIISATNSIRQIVEDIIAFEKSDINLALVEYRDHPPEEETFVTKSHDFTSSIIEMKNWLENCDALGGGDLPEAVADGLNDALKLSWRTNSTKICILISDAPPHGLGCKFDKFPNGCPNGIDPLEVVKKMAEKGITLYCVGCEPNIKQYKEFFAAIAYKTGGQYVPLGNAKLLGKVIVGSACEEISLEKLLKEAENEFQNLTSLGVSDEKNLTEILKKKLKSSGATTTQLTVNRKSLEGPSKIAKDYSKETSLTELKSKFTTIQHYCMTEPASMKYSSLYSSPEKNDKEIEEIAMMKSEITDEQTERLLKKLFNRKKDE